MKTLGRKLALVFAVLVLVLVAGITFTVGWRPSIGPRTRSLTARKFQTTPQRLARGEYLVLDVSDCTGCHAEHDWTAHDSPLLPKTLGTGQDMNMFKGFPGKVYASNITRDAETVVGNWSDDQLARAIREGVGHDGRALFPFMPYLDFRGFCHPPSMFCDSGRVLHKHGTENAYSATNDPWFITFLSFCRPASATSVSNNFHSVPTH